MGVSGKVWAREAVRKYPNAAARMAGVSLASVRAGEVVGDTSTDLGLSEEMERDYIQYCAQVEEIRGAGLPEEVKRERLRDLHKRALARFQKLRDRFLKGIPDQRQRLWRRAFAVVGVGEEAHRGYRDSLAQAEAVADVPEKLLTVAKAAKQREDWNQYRAVCQVAYREGYGDLFALELDDKALEAIVEFEREYHPGWEESRSAQLEWFEPKPASELGETVVLWP